MRIAAFLTTSLVVTALTSRLKRTEEKLGETKARLEEAQRIAQVGWWERDFTYRVMSLSRTRRAGSSGCSLSTCRNGMDAG